MLTKRAFSGAFSLRTARLLTLLKPRTHGWPSLNLICDRRVFSTRIPTHLKLELKQHAFQNFHRNGGLQQPLDHNRIFYRVVLMGAPNVGKSTLYNTLASGTVRKQRESFGTTDTAVRAIVSPLAGTTRKNDVWSTNCEAAALFQLKRGLDSRRCKRPVSRIGVTEESLDDEEKRDVKAQPVMFGGLALELVDTGGVVPEAFLSDAVHHDGVTFESSPASSTSLLTLMRQKSLEALETADIVICVVDGEAGITDVDRCVLATVRKRVEELPTRLTQDGTFHHVPLLLVINKCDAVGEIYDCIQDSYDLNLGHPTLVSATRFQVSKASTLNNPPDPRLSRSYQLQLSPLCLFYLVWLLRTAPLQGLDELHQRLSETLQRFHNIASELDALEEKKQRLEDNAWVASLIDTDMEDMTTVPVNGLVQKAEIQRLTAHENRLKEQIQREESAEGSLLSPIVMERESWDDTLRLVNTFYGENESLPNVSPFLPIVNGATTIETETTPVSSDMEELYAYIDSTMQPLPPPPSLRLARWMQHKSHVLGVSGERLLEELQGNFRAQEKAQSPWDTARLDWLTAERFLALEKASKDYSVADTDGSSGYLLKQMESRTTSHADPEESLGPSCLASLQNYSTFLAPTETSIETIPLNARHKRLVGRPERLDSVMMLRREALKADLITVAIVGAPNTGKSTLLNALSGSNSVIESDAAGTTTDSIRVKTKFHDRDVQLIDTAGITGRWRLRIDDVSSQVHTAVIQAVYDAQIVLIVLDATCKDCNTTPSGALIKQEIDLLNIVAVEQSRVTLLIVNKWDRLSQTQQVAVRRHLLDTLERLTMFSHIPVIFLSAKHKTNLNEVMQRCLDGYEKWHTRVPTGQLNRWLEAFVTRFPPPWHKGSKVDITYIVQMQVRPPLFVLYTNVYGDFPNNYKLMLTRSLAEEANLQGIPIRLLLRATSSKISPDLHPRIRKRNRQMIRKLQLKRRRAKPAATQDTSAHSKAIPQRVCCSSCSGVENQV